MRPIAVNRSDDESPVSGNLSFVVVGDDDDCVCDEVRPPMVDDSPAGLYLPTSS